VRPAWCNRRRERASRYPLPGPFLCADGWWLTDDPAVEQFCQYAFRVDGYEPRDLFGTASLALRGHLPAELAQLELVNNLADFENLSAAFYPLESSDGLVHHWRCDVDWITPTRRIYSIAGPCDAAMLAELHRARLFAVVNASIWHDWEWIDAPLSISNDSTLWFRCTA
jgi:hypothetical protein